MKIIQFLLDLSAEVKKRQIETLPRNLRSVFLEGYEFKNWDESKF